jgi:hypothetical protein
MQISRRFDIVPTHRWYIERSVWLIAGCTLLLATALALLVNPHSIVAGMYKRLNMRDIFAGHGKFTVTSTAKNFRLGAIDGDRC